VRDTRIILDYNRTVFDPDTNALYPGTSEALSMLASNFDLFLVSTNKPERMQAIKDLGIEGFFKRIYFVDEKSDALFEEIAGTQNSITIIVVGDSIRNEITIGNRLGYVTVRFKRGKFADEIPQNKDEHPDFEITALWELIAIFKHLLD
jgi:FMN phosphatase YigB (HAD superfamily)